MALARVHPGGCAPSSRATTTAGSGPSAHTTSHTSFNSRARWHRRQRRRPPRKSADEAPAIRSEIAPHCHLIREYSTRMTPRSKVRDDSNHQAESGPEAQPRHDRDRPSSVRRRVSPQAFTHSPSLPNEDLSPQVRRDTCATSLTSPINRSMTSSSIAAPTGVSKSVTTAKWVPPACIVLRAVSRVASFEMVANGRIT